MDPKRPSALCRDCSAQGGRDVRGDGGACGRCGATQPYNEPTSRLAWLLRRIQGPDYATRPTPAQWTLAAALAADGVTVESGPSESPAQR